MRCIFAALCFLTIFTRVKETEAFTPLPFPSAGRQPKSIGASPSPVPSTPRPSFKLHATRGADDGCNDNNDDDDDRPEQLDATSEQSRKRRSRNMAGGRARKKKPVPAKMQSNPWNNWIVRAGVPALAVAFFLKSLFWGGDATTSQSPSYYYYQSSYYESRVYTGDGNMQRSYKQNVQTNVPNLLEGQKLMRQADSQKDDSRLSQYLFRESPDRGFDQELDEAIIKLQQAMFSDWY